MFEKSRIHIVNLHATPAYLANPAPGAAPLPMDTPETYASFLTSLTSAATLPYDQIVPGKTPRILSQFRIGYRKELFWKLFLNDGNMSRYPENAWKNLLPTLALVGERVELHSIPDQAFKTALEPSVVLLPSGWATCFSVLVTKPHTLSDLATLARHLYDDRLFAIQSREHSLREAFAFIDEGVRSDAFGGPNTEEIGLDETFIITTILAKRQGVLSSAGSAEDQALMRRIVRPTGRPSDEPFQTMVHPLRCERLDEQLFNFMVLDTDGRFIWSNDLLRSAERNHQDLSCYHHNVVRSLIQGWQQLHLLDWFSDEPSSRSECVRSMVDAAWNRLSAVQLGGSETYRNASLVRLLESPEAKNIIDKAGDLLRGVDG